MLLPIIKTDSYKKNQFNFEEIMSKTGPMFCHPPNIWPEVKVI